VEQKVLVQVLGDQLLALLVDEHLEGQRNLAVTDVRVMLEKQVPMLGFLKYFRQKFGVLGEPLWLAGQVME
jgi:hypothetical protein